MKLKRKLMGFTLAVCMAAGLIPAELSVSAAGTDTGKAIQLVEDGSAANIMGRQESNVYYGTYQQSKKQDGSGYNTDPIKWRVLSNEKGTQPDEGDKLFLLADQNLDVVQYNETNTSITWAESTMRSWLNGYDANENMDGVDYSADDADSFLGSAFSVAEQGAIALTKELANNSNGTTPGGVDTDDYIFLLSLDEVQTEAYGFRADTLSDTARVATNTAYVASGGKTGGSMFPEGNSDIWWLRSPGLNGNCGECRR